MPPVVAGTQAGFITAVTSSLNLQTNFSQNNGSTWNSRDPIYENARLLTWISGNQNGFMATWIGDDIGPADGTPFWSFSQDNGTTWSTAALINGANNIYPPVVVTSTSVGFMAVWRNSDLDAFATFTSDEGATWSTPVNISNSGLVNSAVIVSGTENKFMATWRETSGSGSAHAAFSSNNGATWTPTDSIPSTGVTSDVWVSGNSRGFMATWVVDTAIYTSYNVLGTSTWSEPQAIIISTSGAITSDISIAAAESGFVISWINPANNRVCAGFYSELDATWNDIIEVSSTVHASVGNVADGGNGRGFVSVSAVGNTCMFAWLGTDGNTHSSFSYITPGSIAAPTTISGTQKKIDSGLVYELFNTIQWPSSSSSWISGYRIYRNDILIATLNASATSYQDHNQPRGATTLYSVVAFDSNENTSPGTLLNFTNGTARQVFIG